MADKFLDIEGATTLYDDMYDKKAPVIHDVAEGEVVSIPTMEAPFDSLVIKGKTEQFSTEGRNIYNVEAMLKQLGATYTKEGNTYHVGNGSYYDKKFAIVADDTLLTISGKIIDPTGKNKPAIELCTKDGVVVRTFRDFSISTSFNSIFFNGDNYGFDLIDVQIEKGSSATSYEPYTGGKPSPNPDYPQPIITAGSNGSIETEVGGKNLLDPSKKRRISANLISWGRDANDRYFGIKLDKGVTYTFSISEIAEEINIWNENKYKYAHVYRAKSLTYTPIKDIVVALNVYNSKGLSDDIYGQMEVGSSATEYEPFKPVQTAVASTPNGLNGIDGVYDEKNAVEGKATRKFGIGKITADTSIYRSSLSTDSVNVFSILPVGMKSYTKKVKASHFKFNDGFNIEDGLVFVGGSGNVYLLFCMSKTVAPTVEAFRNWAIAEGLKYVYELAEPIITDIPQEEIAQFKKSHSYDKRSTIWSDSNATIEVGYKADTKGWILEQIQNALGQATAQTNGITSKMIAIDQENAKNSADIFKNKQETSV